MARALPAQPATAAPLPSTPGRIPAPLPATPVKKAAPAEVVWTAVMPDAPAPVVASPAPLPQKVVPVAMVAQVTGRPDLAVHSNSDVLIAPPVAFRGKRRNQWYNLAVSAVTVVLILSVSGVLLLLLSRVWSSAMKQDEPAKARKTKEQEAEEKRKLDKEQAFYLKTLPEGYSDDAKPRSFFPQKERKYQMRVERTDNKILSIWSRSNPDGWIMTAADDYGTRLPTEGEMVEGVLRKIAWEKTYLEKDDFEWERLPDGKLAGQPALAIAFAGTNPDKIRVEGEAYVIAARGYALMVYTWAPQGNLEANRKIWADQRNGADFGEYRASWTEARVPKITVALPGSDLQLSLASRVWQEQKLPDEEKSPDEPKAADGPKQVMQFLGGNPSEDLKTTQKVTAGENAFLRVYQIPKAENVEAAYTALESLLKKEVAPDDEKFEFTFVKDKSGKPIRGPKQFGPTNITGFLARTDSDEAVPHQFVVAVIRQPDGTSVGLVFDMLLALKVANKNRREFFDTEINVVLNSLVRK